MKLDINPNCKLDALKLHRNLLRKKILILIAQANKTQKIEIVKLDCCLQSTSIKNKIKIAREIKSFSILEMMSMIMTLA